MAYQLINNLRYGQVSEKMAGRFDLETYRQGAKRLENFVCMRQGGIKRRPPLKRLLNVDSDVLRIVTMTLDSTQSICILLSTKGFRKAVYSLDVTGSFSLTQDNFVTSWVSGYSPSANDIQEMTFSQHYEFLYVASKNLNLGRFRYTPSGLTFEVCNIRKNLYGVTEQEEIEEVKKQGFNSENLMDSNIHYPAGCAVCEDRLIVYATKANKDTLWWSRIIGTSQTMLEAEDSLLDFTQYDVIETKTEQIKDSSKWKKTIKRDSSGQILYHTEEVSGGGMKVAIFSNKKSEEEDFDGTQYKLYQRVWTDEDKDGFVRGKTYVYQNASLTIPYKPNGITSNELSSLRYGTDYWKYPYWEYDLSDTSNIVDTITEKDYVETSTTSFKGQLATGRTDKILWVAIMDSIYIGTESSIWAFASGGNAISKSIKRVASHQVQDIKPVALGKTVVYATKGGRIRGLSLNNQNTTNPQIDDRELTLTADGILDAGIVAMESLDVPEPTLYIVCKDGTMRTLTIDESYGLQGWSSWTFDNGIKIKSLGKVEDGTGVKMLALVEQNTRKWIGYFDNEETKEFKDVSKYNDAVPYTSTMTLHRLDSYGDGGATLGMRKAIGNVVFRTMDSGKAKIGYSNHDMQTTPKALGSTDYKLAINGGAKNELELTIQSVNDEPLTLLALAYEARING